MLLVLLNFCDIGTMKTRRGKHSEVCLDMLYSSVYVFLVILKFTRCSFFFFFSMNIVQPFWPSIVMKKWLNIKPKVYDFSADEVDTESEDDGMDSTNYYHDLFFSCTFCA